MLKNFVFKKISKIDIPKSSKLHRYVPKVRKLYHARCICNNKCDPKFINLHKMAILKKAYLLSFFSWYYHKIMKLKCKARRYLSLFSCNCVSHISIQGTWADALIIQAVVDALKVSRQISPLTTDYAVQERNTSSTITIGHIDECHYVSTTALQLNASISMCNE